MNIIDQLLTQVNTKIQSGLTVFRRNLSLLLEDTLNNSREVQLIASDDTIRGQLGVSSMDKLYAVNKLLAEDVRLEIQPFRLSNNNRISGFVKGHIIQIDLGVAFQSPNAYEFTKTSSNCWPYYEFLTLRGDEVIPNVFYLPVSVAPSAEQYSRTKLGIMARAKRSPKAWHMPPEISGTKNNNYVSRCLQTTDFQTRLQQLLFTLIG